MLTKGSGTNYFVLKHKRAALRISAKGVVCPFLTLVDLSCEH